MAIWRLPIVRYEMIMTMIMEMGEVPLAKLNQDGNEILIVQVTVI